MEQAIAVLDALQHWRLQCHNRTGDRRRYECTVWNAGRRVSATRYGPLAAVEAALAKLKEDRKRRTSALKILCPSD